MDVMERLTEALRDRYAIQGELGRGGMARIYLATDLRHDRSVAIKVLRPDLAAAIGAERFLREIKTTAQLSHPHILPLFDSGAVGELLYYVMPYVEGETLAQRLERDGPLGLEDVRRIGGEVLGALAYAHRQGVVHRDIKPSNILLSATTGHALVADFGIARAVSAAEGDAITRPNVVLGTPSYMAPEQARGQTATPATDVYAVGLLLFECLTGKQYPGPGAATRDDWTLVPGPCRDVLVRALHEQPAERWPHADAFRTALQSGRGGVPRWVPPAVAAAVVLLAAAIISLGRDAPPSAPAEGRLVVLPFTVRGTGGLEYLGEGMVDLLSAKLDGAGTWRTVDPRAVLSLVAREAGTDAIDPDAGRRIAQRMDATLFVLGAIIGVGDQVRLDASLYRADASQDAMAQASVEGAAADVLALLDAMAVELLAGSGDGGDQRLTQTAVMTSPSLPAIKAYLRGVQALREGAFPVAAAHFQEATALDSAFALAWYQLSITADWMLRADLVQTAAAQAVRYADRLPERERLLLEALRTIRDGDVTGAEAQLRGILGTHPEDVEAWSQLGELLFHFGPPNRRPHGASREAYRRLIELEPDRPTGYIHLARIAAGAGDLEALDTLSRRALDLAPQGDRGLEMRVLRLLLRGDARERDRVLRDLHDAPDDMLGEVIWSAGTFTRDSAIVDLVLTALTAPERSRDLRAFGYGNRSAVAAAQGHWDAARAALDSMTALDSVAGLAHGAYLALVPALAGDPAWLLAYRDRMAGADWSRAPRTLQRAVWFSVHAGLSEYIRRYLVGLADAFAGNAAAARAASEALRSADPPSGTGSLLPDLAATIEATVAWQDGRPSDALTALADVRQHIWHQQAAASPFFGEGYTRVLRARVLERLGRTQEAHSWDETLRNTGVWDLPFSGGR